MKKLKGFEACRECFKGMDTVVVSLCKEPSDVCPPIPEDLADYNIMDYLKAGIARLNNLGKPYKLGIDKIGKSDMVDHPPHYNSHPSGIECIQVTEHMTFNVGNAVKYLWRVDEKDNPYQDLDKAIWYIQREIEKRKKNEEVQDTKK